MYKDFWLNQTNQLIWRKNPKISFKTKNNNKPSWFPDGKINIFDNFFLSKNKKKNSNIFF